ncbi:hypothetical protein GGI26_006116 [Coemansia sp. RSA 1358]|uniref:Hexosyltransferase n=1 Tax=Coemansia umbellata TaxID=1424467 RepID=A0ABQ8PER0_9FUNG|nr:hypothetical protein BX070DRAFT_237389 [Coemansia spiralis]KAJ1987495.1 hypothetical protein EDC05_005809 [Coemansia umbellata]KAJ2619089.1 hypothetical protein GGI26_006116 [Coemansia sp. RSA 1358]
MATMFSFTPRFKLVAAAVSLILIISFAATHHWLQARDITASDAFPPGTLPANYSYKTVKPESRTYLEEKPGGMHVLGHAKELSSLDMVHPLKKNISTTLFMFRGDFASPMFDLFVLQKRAKKFCDKSTTVGGCDVRLAHDYKYETLSSKLLDSLDVMCRSAERTDFYAKIDDDLIMSESMFNDVIKKMSTTDCQVAGGIAVDYAFYWAVGQIYIFTRSVFEEVCEKLPHVNTIYPNEDITFGLILNSTDTNRFCSLVRPQSHWHKHYSDQRVDISYQQQHND